MQWTILIRNQSIGIEDLIDLKRNHTFTKYTPRNEKLIATNKTQVRSTTPYKIAETAVTSIKAEKQHDDWLNGGSEFVIFWFFPTRDLGLATHTKQEKFIFQEKRLRIKQLEISILSEIMIGIKDNPIIKLK